MGSRYRNANLLEFARKQIDAPAVPVTTSRLIFERRRVEERHHIVQLAFWYMADLEPRLTAAWRDGAITYSALLRDFEDRPGWYDEIVEGFSDWRSRPLRHVQPRNVNGRFRDL